MSLMTLGTDTSQVEVTNISSHGFWILMRDRELFLSYDEFPWFKNVAVGKIVNVEEQSPEHLYWPELDVDLTVEMIDHPERYPLKAL